MFDKLEVGDAIDWWADSHGRGVPPDHPDARLRTGTVVSVHRHPDDHARVVACLVECRSPAAGRYIATVRPDLHHRPVIVGRAEHLSED